MQECKILGRIPASSSLVLLSQTCRNAELYEYEMATCLRRSTDLLILFINIWMAGKMQWHYEIIDNCQVFSLPISAHCNLSGSEVPAYWEKKELGTGVCLPRQFHTVNSATSAVTTNIDLINENSAITYKLNVQLNSLGHLSTKPGTFVYTWAPYTEHMLSHFIQSHSCFIYYFKQARV